MKYQTRNRPRCGMGARERSAWRSVAHRLARERAGASSTAIKPARARAGQPTRLPPGHRTGVHGKIGNGAGRAAVSERGLHEIPQTVEQMRAASSTPSAARINEPARQFRRTGGLSPARRAALQALGTRRFCAGKIGLLSHACPSRFRAVQHEPARRWRPVRQPAPPAPVSSAEGQSHCPRTSRSVSRRQVPRSHAGENVAHLVRCPRNAGRSRMGASSASTASITGCLHSSSRCPRWCNR